MFKARVTLNNVFWSWTEVPCKSQLKLRSLHICNVCLHYFRQIHQKLVFTVLNIQTNTNLYIRSSKKRPEHIFESIFEDSMKKRFTEKGKSLSFTKYLRSGKMWLQSRNRERG